MLFLFALYDTSLLSHYLLPKTGLRVKMLRSIIFAVLDVLPGEYTIFQRKTRAVFHKCPLNVP